jgi:glutathione S-transferase
MLHIYGFPLSSPANKVCFVANYLNMPYEFHRINLREGEHRTPEYLKKNPLGKIPAIDDNGFKLAESNAIIRYLADKAESALYPKDLQQRAVIDQWMDYAGQHVAIATSKIMFNTYFYKLANLPKDERSLEDGYKFMNQYLPVLEQQLSSHEYIAGKTLSLADFSLLAALDVCEMAQVDLSAYTHLTAWRKNLMSQDFYQKYHLNYADSFNKIAGNK